MSFNLLDQAKSLFTNDLIGKASAYLGERESGVVKAISGILPAILGIFSEKAATPSGTAVLGTMLTNQLNTGSYNDPGSFFSNDGGALLNKGANVAQELFGNKLDKLTNNISAYADVKPSSTSSLLSMAIPAVLGLVGKLSTADHGGNITAVFKGQKDNIINGIPAGLNISSLLNGFGTKVSDISTDVKATSIHYTRQAEKESNSLRWLLPLLLLLLAGLAAWYFLSKGCNDNDSAANHKDTTIINNEGNVANFVKGSLDTLTGDWMYNEGDSTNILLPNNAGTLTVGRYSTEANLVEFLTNKDKEVDTVKGNWFGFTNVHFKTGSSEITEASKVQLNNMVAICKAFNTARFKLGGYTDSTGSYEVNSVVSQKRAEAVAAYLTHAGAPEGSFTAVKGYGPEWPIADNATAEGRAQNRRVAVNVKSK